MAITITCADCGHTRKSDDGEEETCPQCEGTMAPPPKKKYQAKSTSLEEESRGKKKSKLRDDDDDRPKKKARPRDDDDDEEEEERPKSKKKRSRDDARGSSTRDGKAAKQLGLDPGFKNRELMRQVDGELSLKEVLHYACRPCPQIARIQAVLAAVFGAVFTVIGTIVAVVMLSAGSGKVPIFAVLIPGIFVLVGLGIMVLGPIMKLRQARLGWYAVTDRRAIVFHVSLWGTSGRAETYQPYEVRRMWVNKSFLVSGAGDLVFKTIVTHTTRRERGHTTTSTSKQHFGFLGVQDVKDVEALVREVLLTERDDDDDDDD